MRLLAAVVLLACCLTGQQRLVVPGRFVGPDGKPVANADVTAVWTHTAGPELVPRDIVKAKTNASGRFRLELWPTFAYSVWAVGPAGDDGKRFASKSGRGYVGGVVELEGRAVPAEVEVRYQGLEAWAERGPFTVRGHLGMHGVDTFERKLGDTMKFVLPPGPRDGTVLELLDGNGRLLSGSKAWYRKEQFTIRVPAPQAVVSRVLDPDGNPVPGARVLRSHAAETTGAPDALTGRASIRYLTEVGRSDAAGTVEATLPLYRQPAKMSGHSQQWRVEIDGFSGAHAGNELGLRIDLPDDSEPDVLQFRLGKPAPYAVRVHRAGKPVAGVRCAVAGYWACRQETRYQSYQEQYFGTTDGDGSCAFAQMPAAPERLHLLMAIPDENGPPLLLPTVDLDKEGPTDIDLARLVTTELEIVAADGTPAQGAQVVTLPLAGDPPGEWNESRHYDVRTKAMIRAFGDTLVFAFNGTQYGSLVLGADGERQQRLTLQEMPSMRIRVVDQDGKPIPGAMMSMRSGVTGSSSDSPEEKHLRRMASQLNHWLRDRHRADADGRITLPIVPGPRSFTDLAAQRSGYQSSQSVKMQATDGEVELVLTKRD